MAWGSDVEGTGPEACMRRGDHTSRGTGPEAYMRRGDQTSKTGPEAYI